MCQRHLTLYYCCVMIHSDLMLVVIEVLIVLDLEPPGPLPDVLLTGFAEHTAHGAWPLPGSHVAPQASQCTMGHNVPLSAQWVTMCQCPGPSLD